MPPAACCMSMRSRRSEKYRLISDALNADLVTLSAHKIGGPKGVGALVVAEGVQGSSRCCAAAVRNWARRAGTENVAGIAGFGAAAQGGDGWRWRTTRLRLESLRNRLENGLRQTPGVIVFSDDVAAVAEYHSVHGSRTRRPKPP